MKTETETPITDKLHGSSKLNAEQYYAMSGLELMANQLKTAMSQLHEMYHTPVESWRENPDLHERKQLQMSANYDLAMTAWNEAHAAVSNEKLTA